MLLGACSTEPDGGQTGAAVSGTIFFPGGSDGSGTAPDRSAFREAAARMLHSGEVSAASEAAALPAQAAGALIPGELIVRFSGGTLGAQGFYRSLSVGDIQLQHVQAGADGRHQLYRAAGLDRQETLDLARQLQLRPDVLSVMPNWILHAFATPDDPSFPLQWHYGSLNLPNAWDIETGSTTPVTVAIVDSGSIVHPDLQFLPGFDFISNPAEAGHGNGRNADATDLAAEPHGAHVAGTVAARTGNGLGVAGVSWGAQLLPVRVLGVTGNGSSFDILDGILWAAGRSVPGVPANENPARVINLSLGAQLGLTCAQVMGGSDAFFTDLAAQGVMVVAAAGNTGNDVGGIFPANCPGVITVGAAGPGGRRAPYSNFGAAIDVMAPGGDLTARFEHEGVSWPAGVLSTVLDDAGEAAYGFYQGTSMAAPHVSGVVALLLSRNPQLDFAQVVAALHAGATPLTDEECAAAAAACGAGLLDAAAALLASDGGSPQPPGPPPPPQVEPVDTYVFALRCSSEACESFDTDRSYSSLLDVTSNAMPYLLEDLAPARYMLAGWQDLTGDLDPEAGGPLGVHPQPLTLLPGEYRPGVDIQLEFELR
jgi:serine protease